MGSREGDPKSFAHVHGLTIYLYSHTRALVMDGAPVNTCLVGTAFQHSPSKVPDQFRRQQHLLHALSRQPIHPKLSLYLEEADDPDIDSYYLSHRDIHYNPTDNPAVQEHEVEEALAVC